MNNDYHFITHWTVPDATIDEVFAVIADVEALPVWWPSVYLSVTPEEDGAYWLHTKGWLPYTLRWRLRVREVEPPVRSVIGAEGDFEGQGIWTLEQVETAVVLTFDWKLLAEKPLLRTLSPVLKPAFAANHRWAMVQGETSLRQEVLRRRGIPVSAPPAPTTWQPWAVAAGVGATLFLAALLLRRGNDDTD